MSASTSGTSETSLRPAGPPPAQVRPMSWLLVFVTGLILFVAVERTLVSTQNPNFVPSLILLGALLIPVTFVVYLYGHGHSWDVPLPALSLSALFGGVIGTVVAGRLEFNTLRTLGTVPKLYVGFIEEFAKLLVPLAILLFTRYKARADGLLVGVAVGTGFAVLETMGYAFVALVRSNGNIGDVQDLLILRGLFSPAGHAAWTGLAGAALWHAADERWRPVALLRFAGTFLLVVVLHSLWDAFGSVPVYAVLAAISLGLLALQVRADMHPRRAALTRSSAGGRRPA